MKTFAEQQAHKDWILLEFSSLGFIGKYLCIFNHVYFYPSTKSFHGEKNTILSVNSNTMY